MHLPSLVKGKDHLIPPTPLLFSRNALDIDFDLKAPPPERWLRFLGEIWPTDQQAIDALQEWFGYMLTPDTSQQKILLVVGPPRSGKGTIARVLRRLIGEANACTPTLSSLGGPFGLEPLLGKSLAVVSDARLGHRTDLAAVVERLLSISGENSPTIDRKHKSSVTGRVGARFVILTNELPRLTDAGGALVSRFIVLRLRQSWLGAEDTKLTNDLFAELAGVLLWSIRGWEALRQRGRFVQPDSGRGLIRDLQDLTSPVGAFLRDRCVVVEGAAVPVPDFYAAWKSWCEDKGRRECGTEQTFGRDLRAAVPALEVTQPRDEGGKRFRRYEGVRLKGLDEDGAGTDVGDG